MDRDIFMLTKNYISMPSNLEFFPLDTVSPTECLDIVSITFVFNYSSMCDNMLSSTYHAIVHCLPLLVLFSIHLAYDLTEKPCEFRLF